MGQGHEETTPYAPYDFASANDRYATSSLFTPDTIVGARSRTGIITCCDARCSPEEFFNLPPNEAFVLRNGGGRTAEESVVRSLALIQALSEVKEVKVVHHTDCGALAYTDAWVHSVVADNDPSAPGGPWKAGALAWAEAIAYLPFSPAPAAVGPPPGVGPAPAAGEVTATERERVERSVRQDVLYLKSHPLVKESVLVTGWVFDLHTGKVVEVDC
jgi:carbonic anhydrase